MIISEWFSFGLVFKGQSFITILVFQVKLCQNFGFKIEILGVCSKFVQILELGQILSTFWFFKIKIVQFLGKNNWWIMKWSFPNDFPLDWLFVCLLTDFIDVEYERLSIVDGKI